MGTIRNGPDFERKVFIEHVYDNVLCRLWGVSGRELRVLRKVRTSRRSLPPSGPAVSVPALPVAAKSGGGGFLKIVLIAVGVLVVFGAIVVAGMYYTARR